MNCRVRPTARSPRRLVLAGIALVVALGVLGAAGARLVTVALGASATGRSVSQMPPLPPRWPATLQLGMSGGLGDAPGIRARAPFTVRYQYLAGGVGRQEHWTRWQPDGSFVTRYIDESVEHGMTPVFTYYMIVQSAPGEHTGPGGEAAAVKVNIATPTTMAAYLSDFRVFFQRAATRPDVQTVLHVEPDLWGFAHQAARGDDATTVPVLVGSTGVPEVADLPDTLAGLAQAIVRLRDRYAPNVMLGYHLSVWGAGTDIFLADSHDAAVDGFAARSVAFYRSLGAPFDLAFSEFSDRDAAYKEHVYGDRGQSWWDEADFKRHVRFIAGFVEGAGMPMVLWQIPYGNTKMRAMNNSPAHYQDNRVEWLLDDPGRAHLREYVGAGVVAFLFGMGTGGVTCPCDQAHDGVTDPEPINGNDRPSLSADDDGGYFNERAAAYYAEGPMPLP